MLNVGASERKFDLIPAKVHIAVCNTIVDLGVQKDNWKGQLKEVRKVLIGWELPYETFEDNGESKPRVISNTYSTTLGSKANLRKHLESWLGRELTPEEIRDFSLRSLIGKPCQLQVVHNKSKEDDKIYANVKNIMALPENMPVPAPTSVTIYDLDAKDAMDTIVMLPDWIQKRIKNSITWAEMTANEDRPVWDGILSSDESDTDKAF